MRWFWTQLIAFDLLWLVAVAGGNPWIPLGAAILALHFWLTPSRSADLKVLPIALIGISLDAILTLTGVFAFSSTPYWLGLLWIGFVLNFGHSLAWLRKLPRFTLVPIGAAAGSLSYLAGWKLEAVELPMGVMPTVLALSVTWAVLFPLLVLLDSRIRSAS